MSENDDELFDGANELAAQGQHREAVELLNPLVSTGDPNALYNAGNSLLAMGRAKEAAHHLRGAARAGVWEAWFNLAHAYDDLGMKKMALRCYLRSAAHGDPKGRAASGWILWEHGSHDEALHLLTGEDEWPNDPYVAGVLGHLRYTQCMKGGEQVPDGVVSLLERGAEAIEEARQDLVEYQRRNSAT